MPSILRGQSSFFPCPRQNSLINLSGSGVLRRAVFSIILSAFSVLFAPTVAAQSRYENPVDNKTYETAGQFKTYQPAVPRDTRVGRVTTKNVTLLTGEPEIKVRVKVGDLVAYIKAAEVRAYAELAKNKTAMAALVQFNCRPGQCEVKMASQGEAAEATLQSLHDALSQLPPLKVRGDVAFQVMFDVGS